MHWAIYGKTAAELIYERVGAEEYFMGLTNWKGKLPTKAEVESIKNYLTEQEIFVLDN